MKYVLDRKHASRLIYLSFMLYSVAYVARYSYAASLLNITEALGADKDMADHVLATPSQADRKILMESFEKAIQAAEVIIKNGCQKAMSQFN